MQSEGCCVQHTPPSGTIMIDGRPADHCITFDAFPEHLASEVFPDMGTAEAIDAVATMVIGLYFERAAMQALGGKEINRSRTPGRDLAGGQRVRAAGGHRGANSRAQPTAPGVSV